MSFNNFSFISSLRKYPFVVNGITSFSLFTASDMLAQYLENNDTTTTTTTISSNSVISATNLHVRDQLMNDDDIKDMKRIDYRRLVSAGIIGIFFGVGVYPAAYARLDRVWPRSNFQSIMKKSVVEIMTVGIFVNSISIFSRGVLVGKDKDEALNHLKHELPTVTFNDARVWSPYNIIAFSFIPVYIRPTTTAMMESAWQTYISLRSNDYDKSPTAAQTNNLTCGRRTENGSHQASIKI